MQRTVLPNDYYRNHYSESMEILDTRENVQKFIVMQSMETACTSPGLFVKRYF